MIKNNDEPLNFAENEMINVLNCLFFQFFLNPKKKKNEGKSHCASMNDYYCDFLVSNQGWGERRKKKGKRLMEGEGEWEVKGRKFLQKKSSSC